MGVKTGKGWTLPIIVLIDIYVVWIMTSIAGLAVSPIESKLATIFPNSSQLEIQMITTIPSLACIPFIFVGGAMGMRFNNIKLLNIACIIYVVAGALCLVADAMWQLLILSFFCGLGAGIVSPLSVVFLSNIFTGKYKTKQFGYVSAILNVVIFLAVIGTGYMADVNWHLPFVIYLIPVVILILTPWLKKYVIEPPKHIKGEKEAKSKFKFSQECDISALAKYSLFYLFVTITLMTITLYIPFSLAGQGRSEGLIGDLTSIVYFGMIISGLILNQCIKILKAWIYDAILLFMAGGFVLMLVSTSPVIIGIGIFIVSFFFGIAQPLCYARCSGVATQKASTMSMAFFISMNYIGSLICPFVIDFIRNTIFHMEHNYNFPYVIAAVVSILGMIFLILKRIFYHPKHQFQFPAGEVSADQAPGPSADSASKNTSKPSASPSAAQTKPASAPSQAPASAQPKAAPAEPKTVTSTPSAAPESLKTVAPAQESSKPIQEKPASAPTTPPASTSSAEQKPETPSAPTETTPPGHSPGEPPFEANVPPKPKEPDV